MGLIASCASAYTQRPSPAIQKLNRANANESRLLHFFQRKGRYRRGAIFGYWIRTAGFEASTDAWRFSRAFQESQIWTPQSFKAARRAGRAHIIGR
jgi:hypothetical protein